MRPVATVRAVDRVHDRATGTVRGRLLPTRGGDRSVRPFNIAGIRRSTRAAALGHSQNQDANQALSLDLLSNATPSRRNDPARRIFHDHMGHPG